MTCHSTARETDGYATASDSVPLLIAAVHGTQSADDPPSNGMGTPTKNCTARNTAAPRGSCSCCVACAMLLSGAVPDARAAGGAALRQSRAARGMGATGGHGSGHRRCCRCAAAAKRSRSASPEPLGAAAAAAVTAPVAPSVLDGGQPGGPVPGRAPLRQGRTARTPPPGVSVAAPAVPLLHAAAKAGGRVVTKKAAVTPTTAPPLAASTVLLLPPRTPPVKRAAKVAPLPLEEAPAPPVRPLLLVPAPPSLVLPDAVDEEDDLLLEDADDLDWDVLTDEDLDLGPLTGEAALHDGGSAAVTSGPAGRRRPAELDAVAGRDARGWQAILDWELMGFEHEALPDETWAALTTRVRGLREVWRPMVSFLYSLGLRDVELARLAAKEPQLLCGNVGRARSRVAFLQRSIVLTPLELVRILTAAPRVMFLRIERTLTKRLQFLLSLGVPAEKLGHVLSRAPALLYHTIDTMEPRVQYMCYIMHLERSDVGRMVVRHPKLLTANEAMLETRLMFLFQLGLDDDAVRRMVRSHPQLLNYTPDCMAPRVKWLMDEVGMTPEEVAHTVTRLSQLFGLSVDNSLRPKYQYLTSELGGTKRTLLECPTYLSLSLAQRIVPRHRFLVHRGCATTPFNLWDFIPSDARFLASARATADEYQSFKDALAADSAKALGR